MPVARPLASFQGSAGRALRQGLCRMAIVGLLLAPGVSVQAEAVRAEAELDPARTFVVYTADALGVRPFMLAATVAGFGVWVVTLPFTVFAEGAAGEGALDVLVRAPARAAFTRCLGCEVGERR